MLVSDVLTFQVPVLSGMSATPTSVGDLSPVGTSITQFTVTDQDDIITCSVVSPPEFSVVTVGTPATGAQSRRVCLYYTDLCFGCLVRCRVHDN